MPYWVRVFNHGQMTDIDLSDKKFFSVGSAERDDYQIIHDGIKPHHIVFQFKGNVWHIKCQENVTIGKAPVTEKTVNVGDAYVLYNGGNAKCYKRIETAGTYYVCVNDPSGYGRYAVMATLSVNEPKHASSLTVPADPTAYQEVTIPTSTTVETTPTVSKNETTNYIILQVDNPLMNANGKPEAIDAGIGTTPIVYNGRTLVPIRAIVEKMGGTVGWDDATSSVTLTYKSTTIKLVVDSTTATVNGATKTLDVAPMVLNGI